MTGDEQFIFGLHPHGVLTDYRIILDGILAETFPKVRCTVCIQYDCRDCYVAFVAVSANLMALGGSLLLISPRKTMKASNRQIRHR